MQAFIKDKKFIIYSPVTARKQVQINYPYTSIMFFKTDYNAIFNCLLVFGGKSLVYQYLHTGYKAALVVRSRDVR